MAFLFGNGGFPSGCITAYAAAVGVCSLWDKLSDEGGVCVCVTFGWSIFDSKIRYGQRFGPICLNVRFGFCNVLVLKNLICIKFILKELEKKLMKNTHRVSSHTHTNPTPN